MHRGRSVRHWLLPGRRLWARFNPEAAPHQDAPVASSNQARLLSSAWRDAMPTSVGPTLNDDDVI